MPGIAQLDQPIFGPLRQHGHHVILSETPAVVGVSRPAGVATRAVLAEAGYEPAQIDDLIRRHVLGDLL
jgi:hypothetical protein